MLCAIMLGLGSACAQAPSVPPEIALTIDGEMVPYSTFDAYLRLQLGSEEMALDDDVRSRLFDRFIDEQLLVRLAIERGLVPPKGLTPDQRQALAFLLQDERLRAVSESEVAAYYEAHRSDFERPEQVRLRQILVYENNEVEETLEALESGATFVQAAARFSQGPRAQLGGDQGLLAHSDLPPAFADTIFALEPGEVSPVISADYGFLIFQVVEKYTAEAQPLEAVADEIREILDRRQIDQSVERFFAEARERYNVEVVTINLPFNYRGSYHDDPENSQS